MNRWMLRIQRFNKVNVIHDGGGGVACSVHVVLDWMVFQWASMAEDPVEV